MATRFIRACRSVYSRYKPSVLHDYQPSFAPRRQNFSINSAVAGKKSRRYISSLIHRPPYLALSHSVRARFYGSSAKLARGQNFRDGAKFLGGFSIGAVFAGAAYIFLHRRVNAAEKAASERRSLHPLNAFADLVEKIAPSVVHITVETLANAHHYGYGGTSGGSGFVVDESGLILTNAHVVYPPQLSANPNTTHKRIKVVLHDGRTVMGRVKSVDRHNDLATIQLDQGVKGLRALPLADSDAARPGEFVAALGSPLQLSNSVSVGVVSNPRQTLKQLGGDDVTYIQTDAAINQGSSGGPLVNLVRRLFLLRGENWE